MTDQEAKEMLKAKLTCMMLEDMSCIEKGCDRECDECSYNYGQGTRVEHEEAVNMAIKALEEIEQYRALGMTPEQVKQMQIDYCAKSVILEEYKVLGTVEELKVARDKQTPKKPIPDRTPEEGKLICWRCPSCGKPHWNGYFLPPLTFNKVCTDCLQAIDWSAWDDI